MVANSAQAILKKFGVKVRSNRDKQRYDVKVDTALLRRELKQAGRKYIYDLPKEVLVEYLEASRKSDEKAIAKYEEMGRKNYNKYND